MSEVNDVAGRCELVEALGKTWTLAHVGPAVRARYSAWAKARARQELTAQKAYLDQESYREALASLQEQMTARAYDWGTPLRKDAMGSGVAALIGTEEGRVRLLAELMRPAHPELADDPPAVVALVEAEPEAFALALAACLELPDPLAGRPTETGWAKETDEKARRERLLDLEKELLKGAKDAG
jgi:hypothetical protein